MRPRLAVLISGSGRTMANIATRCKEGEIPADVAVVAASRACDGLERAEILGLETRVHEGGLSASDLEGLARAFDVDWIVLGGYLRKLDIPEFLRGRVVNIHPALLPGDGTPGRFGGAGMHGMRVHRAVLKAGERRSGCTVHLVDDAYDAGPVVLRRTCDVLPSDTPETLAARVFELEREAYPEALRRLLAGEGASAGTRESAENA